MRHRPHALTAFALRTPSLTESTITLLHATHATTALGSPWQAEGKAALWNYHLHYMEDVVAEHFTARRTLHQAWIARWVAENPPAQGIGWDSYPISRRACYWMLAECAAPDLLNASALHSLTMQLRHLAAHLEHHLLANHLFVNLKTLWIGSVFFEGPEAARWRRIAEKYLARELHDQFGADGAHYEQSPLYHALITEDLLDILNIAGAYDVAPPPMLAAILPAALGHLQHVTHPDGSLAHFKDTAQGIAPSTRALLAYAARLGVSPASSSALTGTLRLEAGAWCVLMDAVAMPPAYQPGHLHADHLALEISYDAQRVFINRGTSTYERCAQRAEERSTAAHNTLQLDGKNASDVWASFRVGKRARLVGERLSTPTIARAAHDGYRPHIHTREVRVTDEKIEIHDMVSGSGTHEILVFLHAAPGITLAPNSITLPDGTCLRITAPVQPEVEPSSYAAEFGHTVPTQRYVFRMRAALPWQGCIEIATMPQ